jgi:hypothetical protein
MSVDLKFRIPENFAAAFREMMGQLDQATAFCQLMQVGCRAEILDNHGIPRPDLSMFTMDQTLHERRGNTRTVQKVGKNGKIQYRRQSNPRNILMARLREAQEKMGIPSITPASVRTLTHPDA